MSYFKRFKQAPSYVLRPVPIFIYQPILRKISSYIADKRPNLFARLGQHSDKSFLINPDNMPFVLLLEPKENMPQIKAYRNDNALTYQARISGSFLNLLRMVDGHLDGDALFFSRKLIIEGDTEAVVCLRNSLDDIDGSIAEDIAEIFGPIGRRTLEKLRHVEI